MAINLQNQSLSKISLTSRQMKDCFNSYKDKYKKTHTLSLATGFGLTPEDRQTGIQTIKQKLDSLCPHYQAMHELMGNKAFLNPLYKVDAQKDVEITNPSDSDNSDDSEIYGVVWVISRRWKTFINLWRVLIVLIIGKRATRCVLTVLIAIMM
jgi:hypothetical protein